ncbi:three component ABC system middle component [Stenotrophomonas rhizophila]
MMSDPIEHLHTLQRSPFALAPVIHQFYDSAAPRERDLLLSYLVLPMVLYPSMQKFLLGANVKSSLRTLCQEQSRLVGLVHNTRRFKALTHGALLVLRAERSIEVTDGLAVKSVGQVRSINAVEKQLRAAHRLAVIFAEADIVTIYRMLGFKSL